MPHTHQEEPFWQYDVSYWLGKLNSRETGLSTSEAREKLLSSGRQPKHRSAFRKNAGLLLSQFKSPLMLMLIGAVVLSSFLGDASDAAIVFFIVMSTGLLSFYQEQKAGSVVEKLQSLISLKCTVVRDGAPHEITQRQIVPGDIVMLSAGDMLPGDCLIIESNELYANEASLTGESFPVRKITGILDKDTVLAERTNCLWEGTNIISGSARALVIYIGEDTLFGNIALDAGRMTETAFEKGIRDFGFFLMKITLFLAVFVLIVNLLNHQSIVASALFALALAVGMAPELLPAIATIAMSAGAKRMLDKKVIVKKLTSIQNLGEVNLLCTDKTGTLTEGIIKVQGLTDGDGTESDWVRQLAFWNASLETGYANPVDIALRQLPVTGEIPQKLGEVPYDFIRKRLSVAVQMGNETMLVSKGAFSSIVSICSTIRTTHGDVEAMAIHRGALEARFEKYGRDGFRVFGVSYKTVQATDVVKELETDMTFAGFILLQDEVKSDIAEVIRELGQLKVDLKIITGDNANVAMSVARKAGMPDPVVMSGKEIAMASAEALGPLARNAHVFAEVEPQQKERIILALQKTYTVAYMGDGINDVSAIHAADVGISVDNAVDVAREAADFVLMEKDLMVLADGIREGRKTFNNTMKYLYISTGSTFGNMCSVAMASVLLPFLPMLPKQILLTNFLTDFPFLAVTTDNVDKPQLEQPGKWNLSVIRSYMLIFGIHSTLFDILTFLTLLIWFKATESQFQTGWFVESVLSELLIVFIIRTHQHFYASRPGKYLFLLSIAAFVLTTALPYLPFAGAIGLSPLPPAWLGVLLIIVMAYIFTADLLKVWFFKRFARA